MSPEVPSLSRRRQLDLSPGNAAQAITSFILNPSFINDNQSNEKSDCKRIANKISQK
jgi:hypothetical protein